MPGGARLRCAVTVLIVVVALLVAVPGVADAIGSGLARFAGAFEALLAAEGSWGNSWSAPPLVGTP